MSLIPVHVTGDHQNHVELQQKIHTRKKSRGETEHTMTQQRERLCGRDLSGKMNSINHNHLRAHCT